MLKRTIMKTGIYHLVKKLKMKMMTPQHMKVITTVAPSTKTTMMFKYKETLVPNTANTISKALQKHQTLEVPR